MKTVIKTADGSTIRVSKASAFGLHIRLDLVVPVSVTIYLTTSEANKLIGEISKIMPKEQDSQ